MMQRLPPSTENRTPSGFRKPSLRVPARDGVAAEAATPDGLKPLRMLVWLYFWLLLFEGAFRKWWLPQLSDPLLVVRDPVAILIVFLAYQRGLVPRDKLYRWFIFLAFAGAMLMVAQFILLSTPTIVLLYGYRTAFLHLPLIFIVPQILTYRDVTSFGRWFLLLSLPMALLMAWQFSAPADAWVNKTVGTTGTLQIASAMGKIRPPGTFSFVSGSIAFLAMVTAFLGYGLASRAQVYPKWLLAAASVAIGLGIAVSGSRASILSGAIVVLAWLFGTLAGRRLSSAAANAAMVLLVAVFVLQQTPLMHEGREILDQRFEMAHEFESSQGGLLGRFFGDLVRPLQRLREIPLFGVGLGTGTNVGAMVQSGELKFLVSEGEWGRVLYEAGPVFGLIFLAYRMAIAFHLGRGAIQIAARGAILPLLIFAACGINIVSGQFSQPTALGFTVFGAALCLAALRHAPSGMDAPKVLNRPWLRRAS